MKRRHLLTAIAIAAFLFLLVRRRRANLREEPRPAPKEVTRSDLRVLDYMPLKLGAKKIAFLFNSFLPQVNLTLISVLQGVALAVLVDQFHEVRLDSFPGALLYLDSLLAIVVIWYQYVLVFVGYQWPFSVFQIALQFGLVTAQIIAFSHLGTPAVWMFGFAGICFIGSIIWWRSSKISSRNYEQEGVYAIDMRANRTSAWTLLAAAVLMGTAGFLQVYAWEWAITAIAILFIPLAIYVLWDTEKAWVLVARAHFMNSPWEIEQGQILERE